MKSKTILVPVPRNTDIQSRAHCIGASRDGVCSEAATCALHVRQMTDPSPQPMFLARVGSNQCRYRVEVAK
jgi:hypothetical protein